MLLIQDKRCIYNLSRSIAVISIILILCLYICGCNIRQREFRSLGFSEPLQESKVIELSVESKIMDRNVPYIIYLPKGYGDGNDYPVWYGLNSYGSDESMWIDNGIAVEADALISNSNIEPLIMVFPYTKDATLKEIQKDLEDDGKIGERPMDQFLSRELIPYIDSHYYTRSSVDSRFIGGFSMGGMIALRVAFHHPELFSKVGGYSAAVTSSDYSDRQLEKWLYPNDNMDDIEDIIDFDKKMGLDKLKVSLDAGNVNDPFAAGLQSLYDALQKRGIASEFELFHGGHTLRKGSLENYLRFYAGK